MNGTKLKQQNAGTKVWDVIKGNPIAVILVLAAIVVGCVVDNFFSWGNLSNLLSNTAVQKGIAIQEAFVREIQQGLSSQELATLYRCLHTIADNAARILTQTN